MAGVPAPVKDPIARKGDGLISDVWIPWFDDLNTRIADAPVRLTSTTVTAQAASISPTSLNTGTLATGLYRVSWRARVTTAATTSSSLTVSVGYTESGMALTETGAALTGNLTTTVGSGAFVVACDQSTALTYSTTYASVGATPMAYRLTVLVEELDA